MKPNSKPVQRGEIYWCDLGEAVGSEQGGCRPVIIVQNDIGNNYSTTTIVVPLTTKIKKTKMPTHHEFVNNGVKQVACAEQIRTVDKLRLGTNLGFVRKEDVDKISRCVHIAVEEIKFQQKPSKKEPAHQAEGTQPASTAAPAPPSEAPKPKKEPSKPSKQSNAPLENRKKNRNNPKATILKKSSAGKRPNPKKGPRTP